MRLPQLILAATCLAALTAAKAPQPPFDLAGRDAGKFLDVVEWLGSLDDLSKESVVTKGLKFHPRPPKTTFIDFNGVRIRVINGSRGGFSAGSEGNLGEATLTRRSLSH